MQNNHWLLPEGIEEDLPPRAAELEQLRRRLLDLYDRWGYELIFPPFLEYIESLLSTSGGDLDLRTFRLTDQPTGRQLGIRADITPQAARIDAHQLRSDCPTRLCYVGTVLHTRSDGFGGSRTPMQVGAELYGHSGVESELEILCLMMETLRGAGIDESYIDLGHVGIFRGLAREAGLEPAQEMRLFEVLQRKAVSEMEALVQEMAIPAKTASMLTGLAELSGGDALERGEELLSGAGEAVQQALGELKRLSQLLQQRLPELSLHFDLAELRGYHYHTGVVFAAFVPGMGQELARGGRYDDIGKLYGRARPACGFSADLRVLLQQGKTLEPAGEGGIFAPWSDEPAQTQRIQELRAEGKRVVCALPGQQGDAAELGCVAVLKKLGDEWSVVPVED
jgi:ATP phosphoribosyltransferase regulatory subunit